LKRKIAINGINAGEKAENPEMFFNKRAEMYWRTREWVLSGGKLLRNPDWFQLCNIKYKVDHRKRIKIITKEELLMMGIDSPDVADGLSLTFARGGMEAERNEEIQTPVREPSPLDDEPRTIESIAKKLDPYDQPRS